MEWLIFVGLCFSCYGIHKLIVYFLTEKGYTLTNGKRVILGWAVTLSVFGSAWIYDESNSIKDGHKYYVNLFTDKDSQKNYRVPGLIYVDEDGYRLSEVYWSNGGTLDFDDDEILILGEKVRLIDYEGEDWYVELTKEKAEP